MPRSRTVALASLALAAIAGCARESDAPRNVVLVVLDTVRADRLACAAGARPPVPRFAALCARGVWFENASSTSSWTLPAHASLFTGLYPIEHGATQEHTVLDEGVPTLAEILRARGYRTLGVSANPVVSIKSGLARGFDEFAETWREKRLSRTPGPRAHPNFRAVERLLAGVGPDQRFFLFVNYIEAHGPYRPPEPYRSRALAGRGLVGLAAPRLGTAEFYLDPASVPPGVLERLKGLYDGEIAYLDALLGGLLDALEAGGRLDDTLVVVTSDHGENIGDHGHYRHVFNLYGSNVKVPLLLLWPRNRGAGQVRSDAVGLLDVFATVLAAAGGPAGGATTSGRDLSTTADAAAAPPIVAEYYYPLQALGLFGADARERNRDALAPYLRRLRSIELDGLRLIGSSDGEVELY
ncbi:MAG: sulfatase, partial [Myxococcota bacterium]